MVGWRRPNTMDDMYWCGWWQDSRVTRCRNCFERWPVDFAGHTWLVLGDGRWDSAREPMRCASPCLGTMKGSSSFSLALKGTDILIPFQKKEPLGSRASVGGLAWPLVAWRVWWEAPLFGLGGECGRGRPAYLDLCNEVAAHFTVRACMATIDGSMECVCDWRPASHGYMNVPWNCILRIREAEWVLRGRLCHHVWGEATQAWRWPALHCIAWTPFLLNCNDV